VNSVFSSRKTMTIYHQLSDDDLLPSFPLQIERHECFAPRCLYAWHVLAPKVPDDDSNNVYGAELVLFLPRGFLISRAMELSPYTAATLATKGHVFCVGTLAQCLRRWNRLPSQSKTETYLKMGRDGVTPAILRGDQIEELASNSKLIRA